MRQAPSFSKAAAFIKVLQKLSSFEKTPAFSYPKPTIIAPVKVAKSIMPLGLNLS